MLTVDLCVHRIERSSTYSQRRVRLPDSADFSKISAKMDNGVLKLDVPKQEVRLAYQFADVAAPLHAYLVWLQLRFSAVFTSTLTYLCAMLACRRKCVNTPSMWSRRPAELLTEGSTFTLALAMPSACF